MSRCDFTFRKHHLGRDRGPTLFVYAVGGFLERQSTVSVARSTGSREDTVSGYYRIIKNALHLEVEESLPTFALGGEGQRVQIDESHVFTRKYNVGRTLTITKYGWVFGIIEDKPNGRIYLQMVRERDSATLKRIITERVRQNTVIFSDSWPSYQGLNRLGFTHYQVNNSEHFIEVQDQIASPK